jgi:aconitate hydratase
MKTANRHAASHQGVIKWIKDRRFFPGNRLPPARVLMQDFTGVPAVVELAVMRDAVQAMGGDPTIINPLSSVDLVIDHSVHGGSFWFADAFRFNGIWNSTQPGTVRVSTVGTNAFQIFRVIPPGTGICHQINQEYLARVVWDIRA